MRPFCGTCRRNVSRNHLSTKAHRRATQARTTTRLARSRPAWMVALRGDYAGTDTENALAAQRLGIAWEAPR
jgi:hypothetical protein